MTCRYREIPKSQRTGRAGRTGRGHHPAGGGGGRLSGRSGRVGGTHPRPGTAGLGHDSKQPGRRAASAGRTGSGHRPAGGSGGRFSGRAGGNHLRAQPMWEKIQRNLAKVYLALQDEAKEAAIYRELHDASLGYQCPIPNPP